MLYTNDHENINNNLHFYTNFQETQGRFTYVRERDITFTFTHTDSYSASMCSTLYEKGQFGLSILP